MNIIDRTIDRIGQGISWFNVVLILLICLDVLFRYLFSFSKNWIIELEWHLFALVFLIGSSYALQYDKHVRVDVFYSRFSPFKQSIINLFGSVLFLIPWCILVIVTGYKFAMNSWYIKEGSNQPGGLPARYFIKTMIVLGFVLLLLQGLSMIYKNIKSIKLELWK